MSRLLPRLALASAVALVALGGAVAPATAATTVTDQDFRCKYPLLAIEPPEAKWTVSAPDRIEDAFTLDVDVDFVSVGELDFGVVDGFSSLEGTLDADLLLKYPSGQTAVVKTKIPVGPTAPSTPSTFSGQKSITLNGLGELGLGTLEVQRVGLNLTARRADGTTIALAALTTGLDGEPVTPSDADPNTFDVYCRQDAQQSPQIAALEFGPDGASCWALGNCAQPQAPSKPIVTSVTDRSAVVQWNPATDTSVKGWVVEVEGLSGPLQAGSNRLPLTGLQPATTYTGTVRSVSRDENAPDSDPISFTFSTEDPSLRDIPRPAAAVPNDIGQTSAIVRWNLPQNPILGFRIVSPEGQRDEHYTVTQLILRDLQPDTAYEVRVQSLLLDGESFSKPLVIKFRTRPRPVPPTISYGVTGSAEIASLVRGSLPLKGSSTLTYTFQGEGYAVNGTLNLGQTTGRLVALAFLPVTVKVGFVSSGPATGSFGGFIGSTMGLTQTVRIKVLEARLFGAIPLAASNSCQSKQLTDLNLGVGSGFSRAKGGVLTGKFKISDLNGCGALNGLVSPVIAGEGNTISVKLTAP